MKEEERRAILDRALRELSRSIASQVIAMMGLRDARFEDMDAIIGVPIGSTKGWLDRLIEGKPVELDQISDMGYALDFRWRFELKPLLSQKDKEQC